jgi:hypothetical protein
MAKKVKSVFEDDIENVCYLCGAYGATDPHHIFGGSVHKACDRRGLIVHLCRKCHRALHDHNVGEQFLHELGQQYYEEHIGTREQFIQEFIRSYL